MNKMLDKNREMKDSGIDWIGKIPKEWGLSKIKHISKFVESGGTPTSSVPEFYSDKGTPWVSITDMSSTDFVTATKKEISNFGIANKKLKIFPVNTLLYSIYATIGKVSELKIPATINQAILAIRVDEEKIINRYLKYELICMESYVISITSSSTQANLNAEKVNNFVIVLPQLNKQQAIANYLDEEVGKMDELIAEQNKVIEHWNSYKQSLITEIVTKGLNTNVEMKDSGIEWMGEIPKEWKVVELSEFIDFINGFAFDSGDLILDGDVLVIRISDIQNGAINYESCLKTNNNGFGKSYIKNKDILLAMSGGTTGKTAFVEQINQIIATNQRVGIIRLKQNNPKYVYYCLNSKNFKEYIDLLSMGSAQPNISTKSMKTYKITLPPLHEQQAIANYLDEKCSKIDQIIKQKKGFIEQLEEYKQSLIYECVTGKRKIKE